ncbi:aromatic/alkene monooxygenase hydroxylase subunit beta [Pseudonocardia acidicola]|uniref:propane 2-monooxygenase n=1 Tax=Pseudonocardia acidicola TaxID=2724939 RepID=A0ABX1S2N1_9PSEU|nr:aromatic/alkene monooxygenase hydroxylase subunit beta [Pseudonocardia acidicola]NMH95811.1 toluene hydroxylase [Pseudonocardia acidicola]
MTTSERSGRRRAKTWSLLGDVRRKVTPYEAVTAGFHYHFRRDPAPFELDPDMPLNRWYLEHREGSPFQVPNWEDYRDPFKLTYKEYISRQHERELYLDRLIDRYEELDAAAGLDAGWVATLEQLFVPLRFPLHGLQMISLYVGQMAPSSYITNPAAFQAGDEMRRIQRIAYWTKVLANAHGGNLATTDAARGPWTTGEAWQPLRETIEKLLIAYDWGEAFSALNLVVKPAIDTLLDRQLAGLADRNGDAFLGLLFAEFDHDAQRSRQWSQALVRYALAADPALRDVLGGWVAAWTPRADAAVAGLAPLFEGAPVPMKADEITAAVQTGRAELLAACGL